MMTFQDFLNESESFARTPNLRFAEDDGTTVTFIPLLSDSKRDPRFVGTIGLKSTKYDERDIFALEDWEIKIYGKNVYRYKTHNTEVAKLSPPIKIDLKKGMIYFLTEESWENDGNEFETRGTKITYFAVYNKKRLLANQK